LTASKGSLKTSDNLGVDRRQTFGEMVAGRPQTVQPRETFGKDNPTHSRLKDVLHSMSKNSNADGEKLNKFGMERKSISVSQDLTIIRESVEAFDAHTYE